MMKTVLMLLGLALLAGSALGAPVTESAPFQLSTGYTTGPASISCSSHTWTTMGTPADGTRGAFFKALDGNAGVIRMISTSSSSAPTASTAAWTWSLHPSDNAMYLNSASKKVYYWCVTSNTATETATVLEVRPVAATLP